MKINDIEIDNEFAIVGLSINTPEIVLDTLPIIQTGNIIISNGGGFGNLFAKLSWEGIELSSKLDGYPCMIESVDEL